MSRNFPSSAVHIGVFVVGLVGVEDLGVSKAAAIIGRDPEVDDSLK